MINRKDKMYIKKQYAFINKEILINIITRCFIQILGVRKTSLMTVYI